MNLLHGKIVFAPQERDEALQALHEALLSTLKRSALSIDTVINACDKLASMAGKEHVAWLEHAGVPHEKASQYIREAKTLLQRESLIRRLKIELGEHWVATSKSLLIGEIGISIEEKQLIAEQNGMFIHEALMPLGVLLHIAAGNQYGLAFYSVIEGLLTGNINIVKLPNDDDGISCFILKELMEIEPRLQEYIYVFDYSSKDTQAMQKLMEFADAVVVWGGDGAIQSVRSMATPTTKIIEWGHKLSFAYVTPAGINTELLKGLAYNIVTTNQLLCSSCQGIYLETDSMEELYHFCELFLPILEQSCEAYGEELPLAIQAQTGLLVYTESLTAYNRPCRVFQGAKTALLAYEDHELETSILFGNCWVKRLPREKLISVLRPHKSHLQTVGLLCAEAEREELTQLLWRAGLVRVTHGEAMSETYCGEAHDGDYPLRRYSRVVSALRKET